MFVNSLFKVDVAVLAEGDGIAELTMEKPNLPDWITLSMTSARMCLQRGKMLLP